MITELSGLMLGMAFGVLFYGIMQEASMIRQRIMNEGGFD